MDAQRLVERLASRKIYRVNLVYKMTSLLTSNASNKLRSFDGIDGFQNFATKYLHSREYHFDSAGHS